MTEGKGNSSSQGARSPSLTLGRSEAHSDLEAAVIRAARALDACACEFGLESGCCGEHLDALWTAIERLKAKNGYPSSPLAPGGNPLDPEFAEELRERPLSIAERPELRTATTHLAGELRSMASIVRVAANCLGRPLPTSSLSFRGG